MSEVDEALVYAQSLTMKEYDSLRAEVARRLDTAFTHLKYAGAIAAFFVPLAVSAGKESVCAVILCLLAGMIAIAFLVAIAMMNMRWVQHLGVRIEAIEVQINSELGRPVLGWELYARTVQASFWALMPKPVDK